MIKAIEPLGKHDRAAFSCGVAELGYGHTELNSRLSLDRSILSGGVEAALQAATPTSRRQAAAPLLHGVPALPDDFVAEG